MKQRILSGWTFRRVLYASVGTSIIIQSVMQQQWGSALFGAYFASMGIFSFGCAGGNCFGGNCDTPAVQAQKAPVTEFEFEEIKSK